jgi:hypothetical protein
MRTTTTSTRNTRRLRGCSSFYSTATPHPHTLFTSAPNSSSTCPSSTPVINLTLVWALRISAPHFVGRGSVATFDDGGATFVAFSLSGLLSSSNASASASVSTSSGSDMTSSKSRHDGDGHRHHRHRNHAPSSGGIPAFPTATTQTTPAHACRSKFHSHLFFIHLHSRLHKVDPDVGFPARISAPLFDGAAGMERCHRRRGGRRGCRNLRRRRLR